jgi:hypothetical protein
MSIMDILGGGGGAPEGMGGAPAAPAESSIPRGGGGNPEDTARQAGELIRQAIEEEVDEQDRYALEEIASKIQKYIASQQDLADTATGAGPGAKVLRKVGGGA